MYTCLHKTGLLMGEGAFHESQTTFHSLCIERAETLPILGCRDREKLQQEVSPWHMCKIQERAVVNTMWVWEGKWRGPFGSHGGDSRLPVSPSFMTGP
jgi:hypothetical protein